MAMQNSLFMPIIFSIAFFVIILILYLKYTRTYWLRRGVPTVPGHWLFGNIKKILDLKKPPAYVISDIYQKCSENDDILGIYIFFKPFLLIKDPAIIKQILIKDFNYHSEGGTFIIYVFRSDDDCVVFITEGRLGQIHLHRLSSYCAYNSYKLYIKIIK